jgi:hypothetical protein
MLPVDRAFFWQQLLTAVTELTTTPTTEILPELARVRELFESEILPQNEALDDDLLPAPTAAKIRSYSTEVYRLLRLLHVDAQGSIAAKSAVTIAQRQQAYQQRLQTLADFCRAAIAAIGD